MRSGYIAGMFDDDYDDNPFEPGAGLPPPYLAGREEEQAVLRRGLGRLLHGRAPSHDYALIGPRGNGKSALLAWFKEHILHDPGVAGRVDVVSLSADELGTKRDLYAALLPHSEWEDMHIESRVGGGVSAGALGFGAKGQVDETAVKGHLPLTDYWLREKLINRCKDDKPLVALLDEAHMLEKNVGRVLLNASQKARSAAPFMLVVAGTPGLKAHFNGLDAMFWNRLDEGEMGFGLLTESAAMDALVEPLKKQDITVDTNALSACLAETECYPYFLQALGRQLWRQHTRTDTPTLTLAGIERALPEFRRVKENYYAGRVQELVEQTLIPAAAATAQLFADRAEATGPEIDAVLRSVLPAVEVPVARHALRQFGYVWQPPDRGVHPPWVPGIPSLMTCVLTAPEAKAAAAPPPEIRAPAGPFP